MPKLGAGVHPSLMYHDQRHKIHGTNSSEERGWIILRERRMGSFSEDTSSYVCPQYALISADLLLKS